MFKLNRKNRLLSYLLTVGALFVFFSYLAQNADRYQALLQFSATSVLLLIILALGTGLANGLTNYLLYRALKAELGLGEAIGLALVTTLANQLPFSGGLVAKGVYLKQRHRLSYTEYFSATVALYVFSLVVSGIVGIITIAILSLRSAEISWMLSGGFLALCVLGLVFFIPSRIEFLPERWHGHYTAFRRGWKLWRQNHSITLRLAAVQLLATLIMASRFWVAFHTLSQDVSLFQCLLFSAGTILTQLANITPGGIGVREGIVGGISALLGLDAGISIVAVALDRLVATTTIVASGAISTVILSKSSHSDLQTPQYEYSDE